MLVFFLINFPNSSKIEIDLPDEIYLFANFRILSKLHLDYILGSTTACAGLLHIEMGFQE